VVTDGQDKLKNGATVETRAASGNSKAQSTAQRPATTPTS